jgi:hypothetical protein
MIVSWLFVFLVVEGEGYLFMSIYHEIIGALNPLINAFEQIGILYYIGGSVSSSLHGIPRRTQDVDVIADIQPSHVQRLMQLLQDAYYVDEQALNDAVRRGLPYNIIHLDTMMKIDLMPLKQRAFTQEEVRRAQDQVLETGTRPLRIAAPEDAILTKLEWFNMGGRMSSRQWNDVLGIMKQQGTKLDLHYLRYWADVLDVRDVLEQAMIDAG